jgi:RNA polymerase sigma-70 factor, ECF subfamily
LSPTDDDVVARVFRAEAGAVAAALARVTGDVWLAADAVQEAFAVAVRTWPVRGVPDRPGAWITTTARNRALDHLRREQQREGRETEAARHRSDDEEFEIHRLPDDQLRLLFTCCHPALAPEAQVTLALKLVCGLATPEIARLLLLTPSAVAQRIVRTKRKVRDAGIDFRFPPDHLLPERLPFVLACIYLLFTEGYAATAGESTQRPELTTEAVRLARLVSGLMPDEPEAVGLLALTLLQDSRRATRYDAHGDLVLLEHQDRNGWDREAIDEAIAMLPGALRRGRPGPYQLQAAIAALHAEAVGSEATDWPQIAALYGELARFQPSPVVEMNRAVAVAMAAGPEKGLAILDAIDDVRIERGHLYRATRADLLRRLDRWSEAADDYRCSLESASTRAERSYLERRLAEVQARIERSSASSA